MGVVTYPSEAKTDSDKLTCVYNLIEQARLAHNAQGAIAKGDWEANKEKWAAYAKAFKEPYKCLLQEQNRLRDAIRHANFTDEEWHDLSDTDRDAAVLEMYGDRKTLKLILTSAISEDLTGITSLQVMSLAPTELPDPLEDFTGYTEVDSAGDLTVTASKIDVSSMRQDAVSYVRDDKGAGHFGDFEHLFKVVATSGDGETALMVVWGVTNGASTLMDVITANVGLVIYGFRDPSNNFELRIKDYDSDSYDSYDLDWGTYWCTVERDSTTGTNKIYDDAERTSLVDTLSCTVAVTTYQYIFGLMSYNNPGGSPAITGSVEDLDLQEGGAASAVVYGFVV